MTTSQLEDKITLGIKTNNLAGEFYGKEIKEETPQHATDDYGHRWYPDRDHDVIAVFVDIHTVELPYGR